MDQNEIRKKVIEDVVELIGFYNGFVEIERDKVEYPNGKKIEHNFIIDNMNDLICVQLGVDFNVHIKYDANSKQIKCLFLDGCSDSLAVNEQKISHSYIKPEFYDRIIMNLKCAKEPFKYRSKNILFVGSKGTGKTSCTEEIVKDAGFGRLYHQNGTAEMGVSDFVGSKTVLVDKSTAQNYITFSKGPLYLAMIHGTEVDSDGNQVLYDENGNVSIDGEPKIVGEPGLYFLDEFEAIDPRVFLSVFNRVMEIPASPGKGRHLEISEDGGRVVKSHPGFAMILGGNLLGKGIEDDSQAGYTAQNNQHDDSTLDRINAVYEFGYNLEAEKSIAFIYLSDDELVDKVVTFVDKIRKQWEGGVVDSLFSTRNLVSLCDQINLYKNEPIANPVGQAFFECIYSFLRYRERKAWDITFEMVFGYSIEKQFCNKMKNVYIPRRNSTINM